MTHTVDAKAVMEPVMYQERTNLSGPYSSIQGWTDWRECDKAQYDMIVENPNFYATAQVRALVPATPAAQELSPEQKHLAALADAAVTYCPTCCERFLVKKEMTRDEVIFQCGVTSGRSKEKREATPAQAVAVPAVPDGWKPIETAPKSKADGSHVHGVYLLGFCPDPDLCNLESAICIIWWEPLMDKGRGVWYGEGSYEVVPTHWMPLPKPPVAAITAKDTAT